MKAINLSAIIAAVLICLFMISACEKPEAASFSVSSDSITFEGTYAESSSTASILLRNTGSVDLVVSSVELQHNYVFSVDKTSFIVPEGGSQTISVSFRPVKDGRYEDKITIVSNALEGAPSEILLYGVAIMPPAVVGTPVDLGLSVKWADRNLGAGLPYDGGMLYAWGDTEEFVSLDHFNQEKFNKKYRSNAGLSVLESCDDAACVKWGGAWRMPTQQEMAELIERCKWTWTYDGYLITGPSTKSILLPMTGYGTGYGTGIVEQPQYGYYWTSSIEHMPYTLLFAPNSISLGGIFEEQGCAIRPVCK